MRSLLACFLALLLAALPGAIAASESGTTGWSRMAVTLRAGPGPAYDITGKIDEDVALRVQRCQRLWCLVEGPGGRGWTSKEYLGFGQTSADPLSGPNLKYGMGGPGSVCFYEGSNFTGAALCAGSGEVFNDLALWGLDNRFSSVEVKGNVSAAACRDRNFQSYCERIIETQSRLDGLLDNALSSIRIH